MKKLRNLMIVALLACMLPAAVRAQEVSVEVETRGESALLARANGLAQGESAALLKLLQGIYPDKAGEIAARVPPEQVGQLVQRFDILREKSAAHTYAAEIRYLFDREKIDRLIAQERGLAPHIDSKALLVLPVWHEGAQLLLWQPENIWRQTMNKVALQEGRGTLVLPFGDPNDALILDQEALLAGDAKAMKQLAERYGVRNVVVAQARNVAAAGEPPLVRVLLRRPGFEKEDAPTVVEFSAEPPTESEAALRERAARDIARTLAESAGRYSLFADDASQKVQARIVRAEFLHNREWMQLKRAFDGLPNVEYMDIGAIAPSFAQVTFYFRGSDAMIRRALITRGIEVRDAQEYWVVSLPE